MRLYLQQAFTVNTMTNLARLQSALIIDDDADFAILSKRVIKQSGLIADIHWIPNASDALSWLGLNEIAKIDVIFLDINMPGLSGFHFLKAATAAYGDDFAAIPVFMVASSSQFSDIDQARHFDVVKGYVEKPFTEEKLRFAVSMVNTLKSQPGVEQPSDGLMPVDA